MGGAGLGLNGGNMSASGLSRWGLWRGLAMSRCVLEPRSPGKRWLVAGLGNHGLPGTRHSVGMAVLGQLARRLGVAESWARDQRCTADLALAPLGDAQLVLLRPRRLMNANGCSVAEAAELFGLTAEEVYLVHDELDKPLGKLALKLGGSARGHNGVRSCISCLNSSFLQRVQQFLWGEDVRGSWGGREDSKLAALAPDAPLLPFSVPRSQAAAGKEPPLLRARTTCQVAALLNLKLEARPGSDMARGKN
ncbi:probable peptidyl-tRNA hydrolase isoform X3 [Sciurus carolinensis]|uniref:probable peptidyl-tRNA hydrolase isoform X3 n=1 Tax=Sciurus carolinensis TaxID=30640 RepID=UPI001FB26F09|nr:probable peptidyl-tRNA hydrolase isoform X3 [Sciurus carolinensis]